MKFSFRLKISIALVFLVSLVLGSELTFAHPPVWYPVFIPILVFLVTLLVQKSYEKATTGGKGRFVSLFMLFTFAKLLFYSMVILGYLFLKGPQPIVFALVFLVSYSIFTGLQLMELLRRNTHKEQV